MVNKQQTLSDYIDHIMNASMIDDDADFADNMKINIDSVQQNTTVAQNNLPTPNNSIYSSSHE